MSFDVEAYKQSRARFGEWETVTINLDAHPDLSLKEEYRFSVIGTDVQGRKMGTLQIRHGYCPCATCDHTYSGECDVPDKHGKTEMCCHGLCT